VVGIVLLVACTNVANLTLARGASRRKELSLRAALGAGRRRLFRQLLTESTMLALGGGGLGLLLANWVTRLLVAFLSRNFTIPRLAETHTDSTVLGFTLLLSIMTGLLFGVIPALSAASGDLNAGLRESGRCASEGKQGARIRGLLVITETALALVLLTGGGLLLKVLIVMHSTNPGFRPENLLALELRLPQRKYATTPARAELYSRMLESARALPGIRSAALVADVPLGGGQDSLGFHIVGKPDPSPGKYYSAGFNVVSEGYFNTMAIPVRRGREFSARDASDSPGVIVINETAARRFWSEEDPLGRQILLLGDGNSTITLTVVGVTGDVRHVGLAQAPRPEMFLSARQSKLDWPWMVVMARTAGEPGGMAAFVKSAASRVDPDVPIVEVRTMEEIISRSMAAPLVSALLVGTFALLALLLAAVGLYGVVSYTVSQRTHEMGIRLALGAERADIARMILRQGLGLAIAGSVIGLCGAWAMTRMLRKLIIGVPMDDPLTFVLVTALLLGVALAASYLPARRAAGADPLAALRDDG
jgi:putative ABC transport system permease protein